MSDRPVQEGRPDSKIGLEDEQGGAKNREQEQESQAKSSPGSTSPAYIDLKSGQLQDLQPVYPWLIAPQPLPGPYDPMYYPLPTLRRFSTEETSRDGGEEEEEEGQEAEEVGKDDEEEVKESISYVRMCVNDSKQQVFYGTTTASSKGWRRNQWVVSGS